MEHATRARVNAIVMMAGKATIAQQRIADNTSCAMESASTPMQNAALMGIGVQQTRTAAEADVAIAVLQEITALVQMISLIAVAMRVCVATLHQVVVHATQALDQSLFAIAKAHCNLPSKLAHALTQSLCLRSSAEYLIYHFSMCLLICLMSVL